MKFKKLIVSLSVAAALLIPVSVFAASSDTTAAKTIRGFFGIDASKLTAQQQSDITDYSKKISDLQKEFINKMVENGTLTKEQGDAEIKRIDDMLANGGVNGLLPGLGKGGPRGKAGDFGMGKIDTSKLTDEQKTQINNTYKSMLALQKEYIGKMVSNGLLTKAQGDTAAAKVDDILSNIDKAGSVKGVPFMAGYECFGMEGIDTSKLTEQQKTDLTDYRNKMAELQKQLVNQEVSFGLLTKAQGDAAAARIDQMKSNPGPGFMGGMMKGHFGKRGRFNSPNSGNTTGSDGTSANVPAA